MVVLSVQDCASVGEFRECARKILKLSTMDTIDKGEAILVKARGFPCNNNQYDLENFTCSKTKGKNSATFRWFIEKLVSIAKSQQHQ